MERQEVAGAGPTSRDPWDLPDVAELTIGVLGGTGEQGRGLATRWAAAGQRVIIGSRQVERAEAAAVGIRDSIAVASAGAVDPAKVLGMSNAECAESSDVVVVAVPWAGHHALLTEVAIQARGKTVVDCVNPLGFDAKGAYVLPVPEGSAAEQAAAVLPDSTVVAAFHHVSAKLLLDLDLAQISADVMVLGDDRAATDTVAALAGLIPGMRGIYAGRLRNAGQVEALTANLISVNRRYKAHASIAVTDLD